MKKSCSQLVEGWGCGWLVPLFNEDVGFLTLVLRRCHLHQIESNWCNSRGATDVNHEFPSAFASCQHVFLDIVVFATLFAGETFQKGFQTSKVLKSTDSMSLLLTESKSLPGTECGDVRGTPRYWGGDDINGSHDITGQSIGDVEYCWKGTALLPRCTCGVLMSVVFLKSVEGSMVGEHDRSSHHI